MTKPEKRGFELTGRHVLAILLTFFAVVLAANLIYVWVALDSFRGLSTAGAYSKGLHYNETIAAGRAQQASGWQLNVTAVSAGGGTVSVEAALVDAGGQPVTGLAITGTLHHPVDQRFDRELEFAEAAAGRYRAELTLPSLGQWDAELEARRGDEIVYRREQRLWLK